MSSKHSNSFSAAQPSTAVAESDGDVDWSDDDDEDEDEEEETRQAVQKSFSEHYKPSGFREDFMSNDAPDEDDMLYVASFFQTPVADSPYAGTPTSSMTLSGATAMGKVQSLKKPNRTSLVDEPIGEDVDPSLLPFIDQPPGLDPNLISFADQPPGVDPDILTFDTSFVDQPPPPPGAPWNCDPDLPVGAPPPLPGDPHAEADPVPPPGSPPGLFEKICSLDVPPACSVMYAPDIGPAAEESMSQRDYLSSQGEQSVSSLGSKVPCQRSKEFVIERLYKKSNKKSVLSNLFDSGHRGKDLVAKLGENPKFRFCTPPQQKSLLLHRQQQAFLNCASSYNRTRDAGREHAWDTSPASKVNAWSFPTKSRQWVFVEPMKNDKGSVLATLHATQPIGQFPGANRFHNHSHDGGESSKSDVDSQHFDIMPPYVPEPATTPGQRGRGTAWMRLTGRRLSTVREYRTLFNSW